MKRTDACECKYCQSQLEVVTNWYPSSQKQKQYICIPCFRVIEAARWRRNHNLDPLPGDEKFYTPYVQKTPVHPELERIREEDKAAKVLKGSMPQSDRKDGFVYINYNPAFPGWVKTGKAVDYQKRNGNYQTGTPFRNCKMLAQHFRLNRAKDEVGFRRHMKLFGYKVDHDWVQCSIEVAKAEFKKICPDQSTNRRDADVQS